MSSNTPPVDDDAFVDEGARFVREVLDMPHLSNADISPSGELYRAIARFNHNLRNSTSEPRQPAQSQDPGRHSDMRSRFRALREQRDRRRLRSHESEQRTQEVNNTAMARDTAITSPPIAVGSFLPTESSRRSRQTSPNRQASTSRSVLREPVRTQIHQDRIDRLRATSESRQQVSEDLRRNLADLRQAGQQLENESSHLRALLREPVPVLGSSVSRDAHEEYAEEVETNRAYKRRKIDTGALAPEFKGFSYGRYGQVESGKLRMEIESCDGGIYPEASGGDYAAGNVLKNDDSVYCTRGNRCNLVLRHQAATPFCLQELIIKAPRKGFTAPVQEGMVFVSMTADDLLARTAHYQIQYSPVRRNTFSSQTPGSSRYALGGTITQPPQLTETQIRNITAPPPERLYRLAQIPSEFQVSTPQPFEVTTSCSDAEDDPIDSSRHRRDVFGHHGPTHRQGLFEDTDSSSDGEDDAPTRQDVDDILVWAHRHTMTSRTPSVDYRRPVTSNITPAAQESSARAAEQPDPDVMTGELMAPRAQFFIEQGKSKCTIRFDPPVSGRYVLLKMWSPKHRPGGNIDIQSVTVKGFAGPRFFPAVKLR